MPFIIHASMTSWTITEWTRDISLLIIIMQNCLILNIIIIRRPGNIDKNWEIVYCISYFNIYIIYIILGEFLIRNIQNHGIKITTNNYNSHRDWWVGSMDPTDLWTESIKEVRGRNLERCFHKFHRFVSWRLGSHRSMRL